MIVAGHFDARFHRSYAVHKVGDLETVPADQLCGCAFGQIAQSHGKTLVVEIGALGKGRQAAAEGISLEVKFQGNVGPFHAGGALDALDGNILCVQHRAGAHHMDGIDLCRGAVVAGGVPGGVAAGDDDVHPVGKEEGIIGEDLLLAHKGVDLILLVHSQGHDIDSSYSGGFPLLIQSDHIIVNIRRKGRQHGQIFAIANIQGAQALVGAAPVAAQVCAQAGGGVHDLDRIARLDHIIVKALVGEPVVQGAHPAGVLAVVKGLQTADLADIAALRAGLRDVAVLQDLDDGIHHGHALGHRDSALDRFPRPCGGLVVGQRARLGERCVLDGDGRPSASVLYDVSRKGCRGHQAHDHHQREKQRQHSLSHFDFLLTIFTGSCPVTGSKKAAPPARTAHLA